MTRYQLTKLVALAGTLASRKRVQKVVHLLQCAGCPFGADYRLHLYGPYSPQVASLLNDLVRQGVLAEWSDGEQFRYALTDTGRTNLHEYEATAAGQAEWTALRPFEERARRLLAADLWELELASTVAFHRPATGDWTRAAEQAATFKQVARDAPVLTAACHLARSVCA